MYRLYSILKNRPEPPTPDEVAIASGMKVLDARAEAEYLETLEGRSENIKRAFREQEALSKVSTIDP